MFAVVEFLGFNNRTCSTSLSPKSTAGPVMRGVNKSMTRVNSTPCRSVQSIGCRLFWDLSSRSPYELHHDGRPASHCPFPTRPNLVYEERDCKRHRMNILFLLHNIPHIQFIVSRIHTRGSKNFIFFFIQLHAYETHLTEKNWGILSFSHSIDL